MTVERDRMARRSNPITEPAGMVGHGAVLYDTREPERRPCCSRGGRCLAHVTVVYEDTADGDVLFEVWDGTHTTREYVLDDDLLACFAPAGWSVPTHVKPTYVLTREHGVADHHDRMTENESETV